MQRGAATQRADLSVAEAAAERHVAEDRVYQILAATARGKELLGLTLAAKAQAAELARVVRSVQAQLLLQLAATELRVRDVEADDAVPLARAA